EDPGNGGWSSSPIVPASSNDVTDGVDGATIGGDAIQTKQETRADGKQVSRSVVSADALSRALKLLEGKPEEGKKVTVKLDASSPVVSVGLPVSALASASERSGAVIEIQTEHASYELPVGLLDFAALTAGLGVAAANMTVVVSMEQVSGEAA